MNENDPRSIVSFILERKILSSSRESEEDKFKKKKSFFFGIRATKWLSSTSHQALSCIQLFSSLFSYFTTKQNFSFYFIYVFTDWRNIGGEKSRINNFFVDLDWSNRD